MKFGKKQQPHLGRFLSQHSSWSSVDADNTHDGVPTTPPNTSRHHGGRPRPTRKTSWSSDDSMGDTNHSLMNRQHSAASFVESDSPLISPREDTTTRHTSLSQNHPLEPPVLVYHSCARSIVFRDSVRRATSTGTCTAPSTISRSDSALSTGSTQTELHFRTTATTHNKSPHQVPPPPAAEEPAPRTHSTPEDASAAEEQETTTTASAGHPPSPTRSVPATHFQPRIVPLPPLELGPHQEFTPLLSKENDDDASSSTSPWTAAEQDVVTRLTQQSAVVKTIQSAEWTSFLNHFLHAKDTQRGHSPRHVDIPPSSSSSSGRLLFNSFVTSTTLLPSVGRKMRCFGSVAQYPVGVVFGLPTTTSEEEDRIVRETETWAWPAGYAAKTEFNVDGHGKLINGREEALTPLSVMRQYNDDYLNKDEYMVACKKTSDLSCIPYNEVYIRIGGHGRIVNGVDVATGEVAEPSYETGIGLPIALFVRTATYGNLISLMRARARLVHVLGEDHMKGIPLLLITPEQGVKVFTETLQGQFWKIAAQSLNPFQNSNISHKTTSSNADETFMKQKMSELIHLDETIQERLTPEELARIAGGFGATDESLEEILTKVMLQDKKQNEATDGSNTGQSESHQLQDVVNEGLVYAVRSGDYHCSRQLLILYSIVATRMSDVDDDRDSIAGSSHEGNSIMERRLVRSPDLAKGALMDLSKSVAAPPPPPLDTDRLRSATNSDGLLAVLGAAQVLKCMKDGGAKRRVEEVISALEEWLEYGQSVAFRIASWQHQRTAQRDLKIATENHSNFMAFAGTKAITNRKTFAQRLRDAADVTDFTDARFLLALHEIIRTMHSPCLRLELLQYVLGLDNRYSVAHVGRSVELAATCLSMAAAARNGSD